VRCPKSCLGSEAAGRKSWSLGWRSDPRRGAGWWVRTCPCSGWPGASQPLILLECSVFGGFGRCRSGSGDECAVLESARLVKRPEEKVSRWIGAVVRGGAVKSGQPRRCGPVFALVGRVQLGHGSHLLMDSGCSLVVPNRIHWGGAVVGLLRRLRTASEPGDTLIRFKRCQKKWSCTAGGLLLRCRVEVCGLR
jgi:hypothetical protein